MIRTMATVMAGVLSLALAACAKKPPVHVSAPSGQWVSLFNGKDLDDWTAKIAGHDVNDNYGNTFRVEDGLLKVSYQNYDTFGGRFGSLFYNKKLSHYWFRAEYRFVGKLVSGAPSWAYKNSGIQLHSQAPQTMRKEQEFPVSVEFDIVGGRLLGRHPTGDVCENGTRVKIDGVMLMAKCSKLSEVTIPGDEWVTILAEVQGGTRVRQAVNGVLVVDYTDLELDGKDADGRRLMGPSGDRSLASGYISIQSNGHPIEFRRIEILPLD
jgi:hypothetical protein